MLTRIFLGWFSVMAVLGCDGMCASTHPDVHTDMQITSPAFADGESIPTRHTCDGDDVSPRLDFTDIPERAQALVLIVDDPDAPRGTWVHWVYYDLPVGAGELPEGAGAPMPGEAGSPRHGRNDFSRLGYGGPCPPPGPSHRYFFKLYAVDAPLGLPEGATKAEVVAAMEDHVIGETQLMGRYARAE